MPSILVQLGQKCQSKKLQGSQHGYFHVAGGRDSAEASKAMHPRNRPFEARLQGPAWLEFTRAPADALTMAEQLWRRSFIESGYIRHSVVEETEVQRPSEEGHQTSQRVFVLRCMLRRSSLNRFYANAVC